LALQRTRNPCLRLLLLLVLTHLQLSPLLVTPAPLLSLQGQKTYMYAQGVINYHCNDTPTKALHVGILSTQGYYYPTATTVGIGPPQVGGSKPAITPVR